MSDIQIQLEKPEVQRTIEDILRRGNSAELRWVKGNKLVIMEIKRKLKTE